MKSNPCLPVLVAVALQCTASARADDWLSPQVREVFSASRNYFVRVIPGRSLGDTIGFKGAPKGPYAKAEFYRREADRSYKLAQTVTLLNPIAPVEFLVSDDGRLVTIDNWHNRGYGQVVAIYDPQGKLVKSYALSDLLSWTEIEAIDHSVSSVTWAKGATYIRGDQRTLYVDAHAVAPTAAFVFGLATGRYQLCETRAGQYQCRNSNAVGSWRTGVEAAVER